DARHAPDFFNGINLRVYRAIAISKSGSPEINSAQQFADEQNVDTANHFGPDCRGIRKWVENKYRPKIGKIAEQRSQIKQAALRLLRRWQRIVFLVTDRAE